MPKYSANAVQTVNPGETIVFTASQFSPFGNPFVRHFDETGEFLLNGSALRRRCPCGCGPDTIEYPVFFGANIAIPTGGTVGEEISVSIARDGATIPDTLMAVTPAAAEEFWNVNHTEPIPIWRGCCQTISVRNTSTQPILVRNASLAINAPFFGNR